MMKQMKQILMKLKIFNKMQKKFIYSVLCSLALLTFESNAQETVYPAPAQKGISVITHATIHLGNGNALTDAHVVFENGKIKAVGKVDVPANANVIDAKGKHVYPGFILPSSDLGLIS